MQTKMRCGYLFEIEDGTAWLILDGQRWNFDSENNFEKLTDEKIIEGVSVIKTQSNIFKRTRESLSRWGQY